MRQSRPWTLGAVLAERRVDDRTYLMIARPDAAAPAARDVERRLLGQQLAGLRTLIVELAGGPRLSGAVIAALRRARRRVGAREGRLLISAERPELRLALRSAGLEVIDLTETKEVQDGDEHAVTAGPRAGDPGSPG